MYVFVALYYCKALRSMLNKREILEQHQQTSSSSNVNNKNHNFTTASPRNVPGARVRRLETAQGTTMSNINKEIFSTIIRVFIMHIVWHNGWMKMCVDVDCSALCRIPARLKRAPDALYGLIAPCEVLYWLTPPYKTRRNLRVISMKSNFVLQ